MKTFAILLATLALASTPVLAGKVNCKGTGTSYDNGNCERSSSNDKGRENGTGQEVKG